MDIHAHLEPRLLRDLDAMSMAHSIEVRPVFLDHRVVEFLLSVPSSIRMQQKRLLLDAAKTFMPPALLADLAARRKRTFTFPFQRWLSHDLRDVLKETFAPERLRAAGILRTGCGESPVGSLRAVRRRRGLVAHLESFRSAALVRAHAS